MKALLNRILNREQIASILDNLLANRPVKILRVISRTGKHSSSVPWVYYSNELTDAGASRQAELVGLPTAIDRFATFISFDALIQHFWIWLSTLELTMMAIFKRIAISKAIALFVSEGDCVYSQQHGWATVIEKQFSESLGIPRFWIEVERDSGLEIVEPCLVEIF